MIRRLSAGPTPTVAGGQNLLAVDWGTSSLRGALLDAGGKVLEERSFPRGILTVRPGDFGNVFHYAFSDWLARGRASGVADDSPAGDAAAMHPPQRG